MSSFSFPSPFSSREPLGWARGAASRGLIGSARGSGEG